MPDQDPSEPQPASEPAARKATAKKGTAKKAATAGASTKKATAKKAAGKKAAPAKKAPATQSAAKKAIAKNAAPAATPAAAQASDVPADVGELAAGEPEVVRSPAARSRAEQVPPGEAFPPALDDVGRPWLASYPPLVPESYPYPDVPLTRLLDDAAKDFPDSVAVDFLGKTLSYRRLLDQVDRFATALQALGISKGDRVGIALPNCPQHVVAFFATLRLGATVVALDSALDENALADRINDAGCRVLVVLDPVYAKVSRLKGRVPSVEHVVGTAVADYLTPVAAAAFVFRHRRNSRLVHKIPAAEGVLRFLDLVRRHPPAVSQAPVAVADDVALLAFDAPARGHRPRAVMLTHRNLLTNVFQIRLWVPDVQAGRETILCAVPFATPYGIATGLGLGVLSAATMALVPSFDRAEALAIIDKRKPTILPATGDIIEGVAAAPNLRKHDLSSIRAALCDTSLLAADVTRTFEEATGGRLREGLGVAEATALTHANPVYGKAKADRVGLPLSDTLCVLVDTADRGRLAGDGKRGELAVHGPQVMKGYWQRGEDTADVLVDGWLLTGLLAEVDDDGYYCILGRVDATAEPVAGAAL